MIELEAVTEGRAQARLDEANRRRLLVSDKLVEIKARIASADADRQRLLDDLPGALARALLAGEEDQDGLWRLLDQIRLVELLSRHEQEVVQYLRGIMQEHVKTATAAQVILDSGGDAE